MPNARERPLHPGHDSGIDYELVIYESGAASLACGGELLWSSDGDDEYAEEFPDEVIDADDEAQTDDIVGWLTVKGYIPPGVPVAIVPEEDFIAEEERD